MTRHAALVALTLASCSRTRDITRDPPEPKLHTPKVAQKALRWERLTPLSAVRGQSGLVPRPDGDALVIGGTENGGASTASARVDLFAAKTASWKNAPDLPNPRRGATVVPLRDGGALVIGGFGKKPMADHLDPSLTQWTTSSIPIAGSGLLATELLDGRVLVASGSDPMSECSADAALFDRKTNAWESLPKLPDPQVYGALLTLRDGRALLVGGLCDNTFFPPQFFDPKSKTWSAGPMGPTERIGESTVLLNDGRVLVAGGRPSKEHAKDPALAGALALFDGKSWSRGPSLRGPRAAHASVVLQDGRVLFIGGETSDLVETSSVEIYDPALDAVYEAPPLPRAVTNASATLLNNGNVLVVSGWVNEKPGRYVGDAFLLVVE